MTRQELYASIEYSVIALNLSAAEIAGTIKEVTGASVDPTASNYLQPLNNPNWKPLGSIFQKTLVGTKRSVVCGLAHTIP